MKLLVLAALLASLMGCVTEQMVDGSPTTAALSKSKRVPAAQGSIVVSSTANHSNFIDLSIKNLTRPEKISPRARNFIVWEKPMGSRIGPQSLGALPLDKNLSGRLRTVTPFRSFDIFITAEPSLTQLTPTGERLLWTTVNR